jgi:toxin HigB-1
LALFVFYLKFLSKLAVLFVTQSDNSCLNIYSQFKRKFVTSGVTDYICIMIETIAHKGLRLFWENEDPTKLPPMQLEKIRRILSSLNVIKTVDPLKKIPGYKLHLLKGNFDGFWAVNVTGNYRIIFRFEEENVYDIDYIDYH